MKEHTDSDRCEVGSTLMIRLLVRITVGFIALYFIVIAGIRWGIAEAHSAEAGSVPACFGELEFDPQSVRFMTGDSLFNTNQSGMNCFAWQLFIAMNWPVSEDWPGTPASAGEPDRTAGLDQWGVPAKSGTPSMRPRLWMSYKNASDVFRKGARKPSPWGVSASPPASCKGSGREPRLPVLEAVSKLAPHDSNKMLPDNVREAAGGWLTDQKGNLVYFERRMGKAEFDYIVGNRLYDADQQAVVANNTDGKHPSGLSLPVGQYPERGSGPQSQSELGAIELKAAWRVLSGQTGHSRYLTRRAWLVNPETGDCREELVGLVGLHIIQKTGTFPDFVWTTFEHVDNVPQGDQAGVPSDGYSFNNPDCQGDTCKPNQPRIECDASGDCKHLYPLDEPVQVTRVNETPTDIRALNRAVQQKVASATGGNSVFQYYKLVNVLWDQAALPPGNEPGPGAGVPISYGSFKSAGQKPVANTTMETYVQSQQCTDCHASATIAGNDALAADFSFLFGKADSSSDRQDRESVRGDSQ